MVTLRQDQWIKVNNSPHALKTAMSYLQAIEAIEAIKDGVTLVEECVDFTNGTRQNLLQELTILHNLIIQFN